MAYTIYKSTGGDAITINDGIILEDYYNQNANGVGKGLGIRLLGRNVIDYGAIVAQNFLQLASNFASDTAPSDSTALHGQLWFDSVNKRMFVNAGSVKTGDPAEWIGIASDGGGGGGGGSGTVTSVGVSSPKGTLTVSGTPVTSSGTITVDMPQTGVTAGAYTNATVTVDAYGRVTNIRTGDGGGGGGGGAVTAPAVGAPIHDIDGILKGYTSAFIPSGSTTADYVPLHLDELRYFLGWLRKTSGDGMTVQITDSSNTPIGYAFPTTM